MHTVPPVFVCFLPDIASFIFQRSLACSLTVGTFAQKMTCAPNRHLRNLTFREEDARVAVGVWMWRSKMSAMSRGRPISSHREKRPW